MTLLFLSIYDGPNSDFIEWHTLLSLLILSAINEFIKHYVYKQHIPYSEEKEALILNLILDKIQCNEPIDFEYSDNIPIHLFIYHLIVAVVLVIILVLVAWLTDQLSFHQKDIAIFIVVVNFSIAIIVIISTLIFANLFVKYFWFKYSNPNQFYLRHVIGKPSLYLLYYVMSSHALITICTYYILIWQFILFHNANNNQLIAIITLESIIFAIKVSIDLVTYIPNGYQNMVWYDHSPWILYYDQEWKNDYYAQKAFKWFDQNTPIYIKIIVILFNPLSIAMYICSLTQSFLSIYDGPYSDFIEWHTLLSLLILSAINEFINYYVYKQHIPYNEEKEALVLQNIQDNGDVDFEYSEDIPYNLFFYHFTLFAVLMLILFVPWSNLTVSLIINYFISCIAVIVFMSFLCLFSHYLWLKYSNPNKFYLRHVIGKPSVNLLFYVMSSHALITICTYYILIWQFILFHNVNNNQLIAIITLESIIFAIKVIIDLFVYLPGDFGRDMEWFSHSPWVIYYDDGWTEDYFAQKAFEVHLNIFLCLFNPLSISMYICSLTLSFLSNYNGPYSDFIEWHTLLSLLILSAINEIIKHYVYKQHIPYNEEKEALCSQKIQNNEATDYQHRDNILYSLFFYHLVLFVTLILILFVPWSSPVFMAIIKYSIFCLAAAAFLSFFGLFSHYLWLKYSNPTKFYLRYVVGKPSVNLLYYVMSSHVFITICTYYILIWQFILFDNANNNQLIAIIALESIVFSIKFVIDLFAYIPGDFDRNIKWFGYSPWIIFYDRKWKKDYYAQEAFKTFADLEDVLYVYFDFDDGIACFLASLWYLFNPLSISLYTCSLTLSFLSFYDGPNSDFIEWHSLLSLLILSVINEIIKHYAYKQHEPYDQEQKTQIRAILEDLGEDVDRKTSIFILNIFLSNEFQAMSDYFDSLKFMNNMLEKYCKYKNLSDKHLEPNYPHLRLDSEFPMNTESNFNKKQREQIVFGIWNICFHLSLGSIVIQRFDDENMQKEIDSFIHYLQNIHYGPSVHKIHLFMSSYYRYNQRNDYYDDNQIGKVFKWIVSLPKTLNLEKEFENPWLEYNNELNLKFIANDLNATGQDIFLMMKTIFLSKHMIKLMNPNMNEVLGEHILTHLSFLNIIHHSFDPKWALMMKKKLLTQNTDLMDAINFDEIDRFQKELLIPNEQWIYMKQSIQKCMDWNLKNQQILMTNPGTNDEIDYLRDIYSVHKVFVEENNKTQRYEVDDFHRKMKDESQKNKFAQIFLSFYLTVYCKTLQTPPMYVIDDDLFVIKDHIILMTHLLNSFRFQTKCKYLNLFIIPRRVSKVIDSESVFDYTFNDEILSKCKQLKSIQDIQEVNGKYFNIVIDRRENDLLYFYQTNDESEQNETFYSFYTSYLLSFHFVICHQPKNVVRCYLNYAINEQLRFYPQHLVDILPQLFKKPKYEKMSEYYTKYIRRIYRRDFRNSWSVDLYDSDFNAKYKELTGYDFVAINYNRERTLFVDGESERYESDKKYVDESECNVDSNLDECLHINYLIKILQSTQMSQNAQIINIEKYEQISAAFDHLIRSHSLFQQKQLKKIQKYFTTQCGGFCQHGNKCSNLMQHIMTKREAVKEKMDSLFIRFTDDSNIKQFKQWLIANDYDSDCIREDIADQNGSYIFNKIKECQIDIGFYHFIQKHVNVVSGKDVKQQMMDRLYNMIHIYLLHDQHELYRLRNIENNRFGSEVENIHSANNDFNAINFGQSVLCWLAFNEQPTFFSFKEEIINNPASTINADLYEQFEQECKVKQENPSINEERYTMKELIGMKVYCDTNHYQSALRKAFWMMQSSKPDQNNQTKKNFYRWALTLYQTFLYAAVPPNRLLSTSSAPITLYHGLSQQFVINNSLPKYYGIFSTSRDVNTANSFSNCTGLLWQIKGSYMNRFRFIKGIDMQWISCHPNEDEFALFDQYIPIQSTRSYADTDDKRIDILMQQLKILEKEIISPSEFYKKIGCKYDEEWMDKIISHRYLYDLTPIGTCVAFRLYEELGIDIPIDLTQLFARNIHKIHDIKIICRDLMVKSRLLLQKWKSDSDNRGCVQIKCKGTLTIGKKGGIIADECGYSAGYGIGNTDSPSVGTSYATHGHGFGRAGRIYGEESLDDLHYGSPDGCGYRGGGIIEIIAARLINRGDISCCAISLPGLASGGSIKIRAKSIYNYGKISANGGYPPHGDGRIAIFYEDEFVNKGLIEPKPYLSNSFTFDSDIVFTSIADSRYGVCLGLEENTILDDAMVCEDDEKYTQ